MFNFFFIRRHRHGHGRRPSEHEGIADPDDPLSHPVLRAMSPRELADIPFPRPRLPQKGFEPSRGGSSR
jgi:hypothetical protein